jgi:hypothetical protein
MNPRERAPLKLVRGFGVRVPGGAPVTSLFITPLRRPANWVAGEQVSAAMSLGVALQLAVDPSAFRRRGQHASQLSEQLT